MQVLRINRTIVLTLNVGAAERLKAADIIDVMRLITHDDGPAQLARLRNDPALFTALIWELIDQRGWTIEALQEVIGDANADQIWEAFTAELVDFFRESLRPIIRAVLRIVSEKNDSWISQIQAAVTNASTNNGEPSGEWPESSESIPDSTATDSSTLCTGADSSLNTHVTVL